MNAPPRIAIYIDFEKRTPRVLPFWNRDTDGDRMRDWLRQMPELARLVDDALFLAGEENEWEEAA